MALVLDGNGSMTLGNGDITGISKGAIESTAIGAGAVLQVKSTQTTTQTSVSGSDVSIGLSVSITTSGNSKILVFTHVPWYNDGSASSWSNAGTSRIFMDGTAVCFSEHNGTVTGEAASWNLDMQYDTGTISAGTHTFEVKHSRTIGGTHVCMRDGRFGSIVVMEIAT